MTNEEAIHRITDHNRVHHLSEPRGVYITEALQMAIEALERQIPKKPNIYNKFERYCECGAIVKTYQNYCYDCGQALDWSDTE